MLTSGGEALMGAAERFLLADGTIEPDLNSQSANFPSGVRNTIMTMNKQYGLFLAKSTMQVSQSHIFHFGAK